LQNKNKEMVFQKNAYKWLGLLVITIIPVLLLTSSLWRDPNKVTPSLWSILTLGLPMIFLVLILKYGEKENFNSLGILKLNLKTIGLSLLLVVTMFIVAFLFGNLMRILNLVPGNEPMYNQMKLLPVWGKVLMVLWAGFSEEFYFRGYAITRLEELTRNKTIAVIAPLIIFGIGHGADKSLYHVLFATLIGVVFTISYVKTKNLLANMIAHFIFDFVVLVLLS
jgi:membrane protease YdiL (CAAX protease family)